jgi:predicted phosphodiesterase
MRKKNCRILQRREPLRGQIEGRSKKKTALYAAMQLLRFFRLRGYVYFLAFSVIILLDMTLGSCNLNVDFLGKLWSSEKEFNPEDCTKLVKKDGGEFRILLFTDTHINTYYDAFGVIERSFDMMSSAVQAGNPDLIILAGDNIGNHLNAVWAWRLISFLDAFGAPYALIMGNHDGDFIELNDDNQQRIIAEIFSRGRHSLFSLGPDNVTGTGNYGVNIVNEQGEIIYGLVFMDSNDDYLRRDQIDWYEWHTRGLQNSASPAVKSLVFIHIPPPEIEIIKTEMTALGKTDIDGRSAEDAFGETPVAQKVNTGLFESIKNLGSATHIFFGHDHKNNLNYEYQGVRFVYALKTGYCAYHDPEKLGALLITLKGNSAVSTVDVDFLYLQ